MPFYDLVFAPFGFPKPTGINGFFSHAGNGVIGKFHFLRDLDWFGDTGFDDAPEYVQRLRLLAADGDFAVRFGDEMPFKRRNFVLSVSAWLGEARNEACAALVVFYGEPYEFV